MLLVRPLPFEDECLISYLTRVAEDNRYKSPAFIAKLAGIGMKNNRLAAKSLLAGQKEIRAELP